MTVLSSKTGIPPCFGPSFVGRKAVPPPMVLAILTIAFRTAFLDRSDLFASQSIMKYVPFGPENVYLNYGAMYLHNVTEMYGVPCLRVNRMFEF